MKVVWLLVLLVGLYGLHRAAVWAESRGYIYYLRGRGSSGSMGSAFLEVQSIFEPGVRHTITERQRESVHSEESGDPPPKPRTR